MRQRHKEPKGMLTADAMQTITDRVKVKALCARAGINYPRVSKALERGSLTPDVATALAAELRRLVDDTLAVLSLHEESTT